LQGKREGKEEKITQEIIEGESQEMKKPIPHPNLRSYYRFIEGGRVFPQKFSIPLSFEPKKERARTHRCMQIAKSKGVEDVGHMEEKL